MESRRDEIDLASELRALRPTPREEFAAKLDARAAAGFPRTSRRVDISALLDRVRATPPRRLLAPAGAGALAAVVVATAVIASGNGDNAPTPPRAGSVTAQEAAPIAPSAASSKAAGETTDSSSGVAGTALPAPAPPGRYASNANHRSVERDAQIVLGTDPAEVREVSANIFETVHNYDGIVLNSSVSDGTAGDAGATFELLIPSAKLSDALASLSGLAEVRARHESSQDITAPTIGVDERLQDANAKIEGLLGQLATADSDAEREAVEAKLQAERAHVATLRSRLTALERRANLSRVSLQIETGETSTSTGSVGPWSIDDALGDAGRILAVAAGVALIGLAILTPIALLVLLTWLARRAWIRGSRRRALA